MNTQMRQTQIRVSDTHVTRGTTPHQHHSKHKQAEHQHMKGQLRQSGASHSRRCVSSCMRIECKEKPKANKVKNKIPIATIHNTAHVNKTFVGSSPWLETQWCPQSCSRRRVIESLVRNAVVPAVLQSQRCD